MNTQVVLKTKFPSLPSDWDVGTSFKKHTALSKCKDATIEPAGRWYEAYANRRRRGRTLSQDEEEALAAHLAEAELGAESEGEDEMIDDVDGNDFKGIDPADWKENDQYKILGLGRLRYKANDEQIKQAYRKACLAHHPDKKARLTNGMDDDAIFKGIKLAYDTLTAPARRRAWDSVDPTFDDSFPAQKKGLSAKEFIKRYSKVVEDNSRFSTKQPVPGLGLVEATRAEVEAFYNFWYDFDSWREFSWNDKEDVSSADISRDERRYRDKKNVAARKKAKKEDNQRMTKLVDAIFHSDPRLAEIKAKEKAEKNKGANAKAAQLAKEKEEARIAKEAADIQAAKEAEAAKSAAGDKKKSKEAAKNKIKKARQAVRKACKENNYYMPEGTSLDETEERMSHMELLCSKLTVDELEALVANGLDGESFAKAVESQGATAKRY
ncbi:hypothetical protein SARC_11599 [Sphaeroforma arctica JP610]|uniref:J domain-containing protein n=1 Tax=Sphaeroforma arctica JP610 TaxID=667725 RepID=A0A0L0FGH6_9EUKA|nr:hypothetical protein SARC_11599 [Sphaeroforma arctica JP610]KNC75884.1 hypothetical protein SARC_11599 [Sphaeroforma arctica JP610]|eukprot:XP_014149786.1 hypothetical protein SARC_11599 [Sphaeroforma arctica JP610]